jgi:hypothetical protein
MEEPIRPLSNDSDNSFHLSEEEQNERERERD